MDYSSFSDSNLRTYCRRGVTRKSGFHTCNETTGGECYIVRAQSCFFPQSSATAFHFRKENIQVPELFTQNWGMLAFGGYVKSSYDVEIALQLVYYVSGIPIISPDKIIINLLADQWTGIGIHKRIEVTNSLTIERLEINMVVTYADCCGPIPSMQFISFDMGAVTKQEYFDDKLYNSFTQNRSLYLPSIYYFDTMLMIESYLLSSKIVFESGDLMVFKSCNRCGRYLPINIQDELKTLAFSSHCKKRAPCVHSTFRAYTIKNPDEFGELPFELENGKIISHYGHQLECKVCKKFFVNAPLNPQRNSQQFKEDGLRRRAIEVLVNFLLKRNLVHFEFEKRTKHEFSEYIWEKFGHKCFKCGKELKLNEMALDHTMPLAFLYRLDETATCLCESHNSAKSDNFPVDYYTEDEIVRLASITGLSIEQLHTRSVNSLVLELLVQKIVWFYDDFLMSPEYQKIRDGIRTADKINDSLRRVIAGQADLIEEYRKKQGHYPSSVSQTFI